ncbi:MAG: hypothetical protein KDC53_18060 [Saprospiraceae bacterium]|nr:hypothetical protein [Saprospiraceae bacterium]
MATSMIILQRIMLCLPIAAFLYVIDQSTWPFIAAISLPLIAARYLPLRLWQKRNDKEEEDRNFAFARKFGPLILIGVTIFTLNTSPKKLIEVKKCEYELAGHLEEQIPELNKTIGKSLILILQNRIDL